MMIRKSGTERIGVIEVGSQSVRYLVADFEWDGSYRRTQARTAYKHGIELNNLDDDKIAAMLTQVEAYYNDLERHRGVRAIVYGTELCRRLAERGHPKLPRFLHILKPTLEAFGAWAAGFISTEMQSDRYTIVDQGGGSTEIISADWNGVEPLGIEVYELGYGNQAIEEKFRMNAGGIVKSLTDLLDASSPGFKLHKAKAPSDKIIFLGSVATKLAFNIRHKKGDDHIYDPRLADKTTLTVREIMAYFNDMTSKYRIDPQKTIEQIDPRVEEYHLVMPNAVLFMLTCVRLGYDELTVSTNSTRHGMAFLARRDLYRAISSVS
jgi:exopolyphosphatase/pppGpp-phosphohydrolase